MPRVPEQVSITDQPLPRAGRAGRPPVQRLTDGTALRQAERVKAASGDFQPAAQVFAALGSTVRLHIVQLLSERGPMTAAELRVSLPVGDIGGHLRMLIDAGIKAMSSDGSMHGDGRFGTVVSPGGGVLATGHEEHGFIRGSSHLRVGDLIRIRPNHACGLTNMHSRVFAIEDDVVADIWPVLGRH